MSLLRTGWEGQGQYNGGTKGDIGRGHCIGVVFVVSLSILRYGSKIIVSIEEISPLGRLPVWDKLACKVSPDWPDRLEGP